MRKNKTELVIILDRSGSMQSIRTDMEQGFKAFLEEQKRAPGECFISLYQFDTEFEAVYEAQNIQNINGLTLEPRGGTALHDAVCEAADRVGRRLASTPEEDRPEHVIVMTITDGEENSSLRKRAVDVKEMINHQSSKYSWRFLFLGANQDAVVKGREMGYDFGKTMTYCSSSAGVSNVWKNSAKAATMMRASVDYNFTTEDRAESLAEDTKTGN